MSETVGRYRILRPLGEGGMGRVLLAEAAGPHGFARRVVVKIVRDPADPSLRQALLDEARLAASLVHRNIVPVLDLEARGDERLVILEHIDGLDLGRLLARKSRLPWPVVAFIGMEVAAGLDYAHRRTDGAGRPLGIVHRDISPSNILLSWEGEVKVTDFGVAQVAARADGAVGGKRAYMAPEQARGAAVDARADIFALGVVLREALAGENSEAPLAAELAPEGLRQVIASATAKHPDARFSTAAALRNALVALPGQPRDPARELQEFLAEVKRASPVERRALVEAVLGAGRPLTRLITRARTRRPLAWVAVGAILVVFVAAIVVAALQKKSPPPAPERAAVEKPAAPAPVEPKAKGSLSVNAIPWARVYLDGVSLGNTPRVRVPVEAGRHRLRLITIGGDVRTRVVEVAPGREVRVSIDFGRSD